MESFNTFYSGFYLYTSSAQLFMVSLFFLLVLLDNLFLLLFWWKISIKLSFLAIL